MRIGLFTDTYIPTINGISFVVESTKVELEKLGHEVFIFAPAPTIRHKETDDHIIRFRAIRGIVFRENMTSLYFPPSQVRKIDQLDLDVIHFFSPFQVGLLGAYVAIKNNTPLIGQYCTDAYHYFHYYPKASAAIIWLPAALPIISQYPVKHWRDIIKKVLSRSSNVDEEWRQRVLGQALRIVHDQCTSLIAPSKKMAQQLRSFGIKQPITILPNGVDKLAVDKQYQAEFKQRYSVQPSQKIVLYVGRLGEEKNIELLINAFDTVVKAVPQARLFICGDFEHRTSLESLAANQEHADKIVFTGMIPHKQLGSVYGLAKVFAFPSMTDTQGLVLHEAAYAGLPIVMIDKDITSVVQNNKNGLFAQNNSNDFAKKIITILSNSKKRTLMGAHSKKVAAQYTAHNQTKKLEKIYLDVKAKHL